MKLRLRKLDDEEESIVVVFKYLSKWAPNHNWRNLIDCCMHILSPWKSSVNYW